MDSDSDFKVSDIHDSFVTKEFDRLTELDIAKLLNDRSNFIDTGCPACHRIEAPRAFSHQGLDYRRCAHCETLYISPAPSEDMHLKYVLNSSAMKFWREQMPPNMKAGRVSLYQDRLRFVQEQLKRMQISPRSSIEIGAGNGEFGEELVKHTNIADIVLLEPQELKVDNDRVRVINAGFDALSSVETQFDVAFAFELIEHLLEPDNFLRLVHGVLKPGAPLILSTPNEKSVETRTLGCRSSNIIFDHVRLYNPEAMHILMERNGFRIVSLTTPGKLDTERLLAVFRSDPGYFNNNPTIRFLLTEAEDKLEAFQRFLVRELSSSHMRVVAVKDGTWRGTTTPRLPKADLR